MVHVGLLDLPAEVLDIILSFQGTLSLAAVRLTCQALRDAAAGDRKRVVIRIGDSCTARACASPRVLQLLHAFRLRLNEADQGPDAIHTTILDSACSSGNLAGPESSVGAMKLDVQRIQRELIKDLAPEFESLKVKERWWSHVACVGGLRSLHVEGFCDTAILQDLLALGHLTFLKLNRLDSAEEVQQICSRLALSHLDIGTIYVNVDFLHMLDSLASGKASGLRDLAIPFPAAKSKQLSQLTALKALTALDVGMWDCNAELGGLAALIGLKSLRMATSAVHIDPIVESLMPLTAMTGLTLLDLDGNDGSDGWSTTQYRPYRTVPQHVSALSTLKALRVLRCSLFHKAELVAGDLLPVQFGFLRSATALEELALAFQASFWLLPDESIDAVREAVSGLSSLKKVAIRLGCDRAKQHYYAPLSAFAAASSIETILYRPLGSATHFTRSVTASRARECMRALTKLRSLTVGGIRPGVGKAPRCADLLAGLPSTHLTSLNIGVFEADLALMQQYCTVFRPAGACLALHACEVWKFWPALQLEMSHAVGNGSGSSGGS